MKTRTGWGLFIGTKNYRDRDKLLGPKNTRTGTGPIPETFSNMSPEEPASLFQKIEQLYQPKKGMM